MKPKIVLFDWDNTLCDTFPALHDSYNHMLRQFGHAEWDADTARHNIRHVAHEYLPTLFGTRWEEALDVYRTYYKENYAISPLFDGCLGVMKRLRKMGARLGVVSNKNELILEVEVREGPFLRYMDVVIGGVNERPGKPNPMVMDIALQRMKYEGSRQDVWYVGDTDVDMQFAHKAGVKSVFIENAGLDKREDIEARYAPDYAFNSMAEFLKFLD